MFIFGRNYGDRYQAYFLCLSVILFFFTILLFTARVRTYDGRLCFYRCVSVQGGVPGLRFLGGVPGLRFSEGGPGLRFSGGGSQVSDFWGGGYPVSVKGKIFDTRFGLIHVQTGKKNFFEGPPPQNSKKLLWPRCGRYASCVHAGGLSCLLLFLFFFSTVFHETCQKLPCHMFFFSTRPGLTGPSLI